MRWGINQTILIIAIGVLLVPLITKNHIYQGVALGGDTKNVFLPYLQKATDGASLIELSKGFYPVLGVSMGILGVLNRVLRMNPEVLFFLYSLLVLFGVAVTLYYLGKTVGGIKTGWLMLALGLFSTTSLLSLYSYAMLANLLNVYIILLWAIIAFSRWFISRKTLFLVFGMVLITIYSMLHPTAFYLPYAMGVLLIALVVLASRREIRWTECGLYAIIAVSVIVINLTMSNLFLQSYLTTLTASIPVGIQEVIQSSLLANLWGISGTFVQYLAPITIIIALLVGIEVYETKLWRCIPKVQWCPLLILGSFAVALIGGSYIRATQLPERIILDASAMITFIIAGLLGELIKRKELSWLRISSYSMMGFGVSQTIVRWVI